MCLLICIFFTLDCYYQNWCVATRSIWYCGKGLWIVDSSLLPSLSCSTPLSFSPSLSLLLSQTFLPLSPPHPLPSLPLSLSLPPSLPPSLLLSQTFLLSATLSLPLYLSLSLSLPLYLSLPPSLLSLFPLPAEKGDIVMMTSLSK